MSLMLVQDVVRVLAIFARGTSPSRQRAQQTLRGARLRRALMCGAERRRAVRSSAWHHSTAWKTALLILLLAFPIAVQAQAPAPPAKLTVIAKPAPPFVIGEG